MATVKTTQIQYNSNSGAPSAAQVSCLGYGFRLVPVGGSADFPVRVRVNGQEMIVPDWGWIPFPLKSNKLEIIPYNIEPGSGVMQTLGEIDTPSPTGNILADPPRYLLVIAETTQEMMFPVGNPSPTVELVWDGPAGGPAAQVISNAAPGSLDGVVLGRSVTAVQLMFDNAIGQTGRVKIGYFPKGSTAVLHWYDGGQILDGTAANQVVDLLVYNPTNPQGMALTSFPGSFERRIYIQTSYAPTRAIMVATRNFR